MNNVRQAAEKLGLTESGLRSWILQGRIEFVKVGRLVKITDKEIARIINAGTVPARRNPEAA